MKCEAKLISKENLTDLSKCCHCAAEISQLLKTVSLGWSAASTSARKRGGKYVSGLKIQP